jgi:hypothetical protein
VKHWQQAANWSMNPPRPNTYHWVPEGLKRFPAKTSKLLHITEKKPLWLFVSGLFCVHKLSISGVPVQRNKGKSRFAKTQLRAEAESIRCRPTLCWWVNL